MVVTEIRFVSICTLLHIQVKNWVKELRKMLGNEICLCIVGKYHYIITFVLIHEKIQKLKSENNVSTALCVKT